MTRKQEVILKVQEILGVKGARIREKIEHMYDQTEDWFGDTDDLVYYIADTIKSKD